MVIRRREYILSILIICMSLCILMGMAKPKEDRLKLYIDTWEMMNILDELGYDGLDYCPAEMDISIWSPIDGEKMNLREMTALAEEGYSCVNPLRDGAFEDISTKGLKRIAIRGVDEEGLDYDVIVTNAKTSGKDDPFYRTYMVINVVHKLEDKGAYPRNYKEIIESIENYFYEEGAKPRTIVSLKGTFRGELDKKERKALAKALARSLRGSNIQSMEDGSLISLSGYSPILDIDPVGNMNFQIALRYNHSMDITYIWVGTPLIAVEY